MKRALVGLAVITAFSLVANQALAGRHSHGSSGSHGSWGSHGSSGSWGSHGSSGSWGSHGSSGSWGSHGSSGSWGSHGSSGGYYYYHVVPQPPAPSSGDAAPKPADSTLYSRGAMMLTVSVPADAKVLINDKPTTSTGTVRKFTSRGLEPGRVYTYHLKAEYEKDGQAMVKEKTVQVRVGESLAVTLGEADPEVKVAAKPAKTGLLVRVPADAKVFLAGQETKADGEVREFTTNRLAAGQRWEGYKVRVELERNGQKLAKEQTIDIEFGELKELTFDFGPTQVAQNQPAAP